MNFRKIIFLLIISIGLLINTLAYSDEIVWETDSIATWGLVFNYPSDWQIFEDDSDPVALTIYIISPDSDAGVSIDIDKELYEDLKKEKNVFQFALRLTLLELEWENIKPEKNNINDIDFSISEVEGKQGDDESFETKTFIVASAIQDTNTWIFHFSTTTDKFDEYKDIAYKILDSLRTCED